MGYVAYVLVVSGTVIAYQRDYEATEIDRISEQLEIVAELKAERIQEWFDEARADATILQQRTFDGSLAILNDNPNNEAALENITASLETMRIGWALHSMVLLDSRGNLVVAVPALETDVFDSEHLADKLPQIDSIKFDDLHVHPDSSIRLAWTVPIGLDSGDSSNVIGYVIMEADPDEFLYPYLEEWPTTSKTGESLLFRHDGDEILFLNELRHQSETTLALRLPVDSPTLPAAVIARTVEAGQQPGLLEGLDYRGVAVFAWGHQIPNTPWFLLEKIDRSEALEFTYRNLFAQIVVVLLLALIPVPFWIAARANLKARQAHEVYEADLVRANTELEAFSYSVSHDLRAPLRAVDGFTSALLEDYGDRLDDVGRDYAERARSGARRMALLIDDLLQLSRLARIEMTVKKADLSAIAEKCVAELRAADPERDVQVDIAPGIQVRADRALIEVVLRNLLGNAWKFTSKNDVAKIEFRSQLDHGRPVFLVRDDGVGFDAQYADELFGTFQRLHRVNEFPGTGIGLATVRRLIERHGGTVWAESPESGGATFYFTLGTKD